MSQVNSAEVPSGSGLSVRQGINDVLAALMSSNSGSSEPANPVAGMVWFDTTANDVKVRNASNTGWLLLSDMIGAVEYDRGQSLTSTQKQQARENIAAVSYEAQTLTSGQQAQVRANLGLGAVATDGIVPIARGGTGADNAASARANLQAAWTPDGRWESWYVGLGSAGVLPSGGRWAYLLLAFVSGVQGAGLSGGTAAGGTQVAPAVAGRDYAGMRWRIS